MNFYSGWQYLLIDVANAFGLDKKLFEERIDWAHQNLHKLEDLYPQAESKNLYAKAVLAIRKAQAHIPTGHMVGVDGVCSGMQMMSVLTGCVKGCEATGLVGKGRRPDAYTSVTQAMQELLGAVVAVSRQDAKDAVMTSLYGSKAEPKRIFGEGTIELDAFYKAIVQVAPGAWELLQDLLNSWNAGALFHAWKLPDGYDAHVKVFTKKECRIEVDELAHSTFSYEFYINEGQERGLSNVANVTHSVDAYVLRSMHRRCNYNRDHMEYVHQCIQAELDQRGPHYGGTDEFETKEIKYLRTQYERSTLADARILDLLDQATVSSLSVDHLTKLQSIVEGMLQYKPFPIVTVHDEFKAHPNNVNWVRWQYREIMAEIADSNLLDDLLSQVYGTPGKFHKLSKDLGKLIRESEYGLC